MKFLISVFLLAFPLIPASPFIILAEICQPPLLLCPHLRLKLENNKTMFQAIIPCNFQNKYRIKPVKMTKKLILDPILAEAQNVFVGFTSNRSYALLQAITVCNFKENWRIKLEEMAKNLVSDPILADLVQIQSTNFFTKIWRPQSLDTMYCIEVHSKYISNQKYCCNPLNHEWHGWVEKHFSVN